jgi:phospholipase C
MELRRALAPVLGVVMLGLASVSPVTGVAEDGNAGDAAARAGTTTPIKHLVVIFQENVSFDHYFGTYPQAANPAGEPRFVAKDGTPSVNGLGPALLNANPNLGNPQRLARSEALTCDQGHDYTPEQNAVDHGALDRFVQEVGNGPTRAECDNPKLPNPTPNDFAVMDYYDGNTVTGLWNYAQHFAMSDNSFGTTYGPSTPGVLNLVAGNTYPVLCAGRSSAIADPQPDVYDLKGDVKPCPGGVSTTAPPGSTAGTGTGTVVNDPDPYYDACANPKITSALGGGNIGNLLSQRSVTWGFFQGGFSSPDYRPGVAGSFDPKAICTGAHYNIGAGAANQGQPCVRHTPAQPIDAFCVGDYSAHHQPFQYYASTANPAHLPPSSIAEIGQTDQANHQYDLADFWAATNSGHLPAVSYLKAAKFQDGHAGYSDPLDEQRFLVDTINRLQARPEWRSTAVVIAYDDSDGWYDHVLAPITTQSQTGLDSLTAPGQCGPSPNRVPAGQQARCGLGPRLPLLVVSGFARRNYVDHSITDQSSILRFAEDNWKLGRVGAGSTDALTGPLTQLFDFSHGPQAGPLTLDPATGRPSGGGDDG